MKHVLLIICLISASYCYAQKDYCNDIIVKNDELKGTSDIRTPEVGPRGATIEILKTATEKYKFDLLRFMFMDGYSNYNATGIYFKLDDGTIIKDENEKIRCAYISSRTYLFQGSMVIDASLLEKLKTKKIVKYRVADLEKELSDKDATKLMAYINCMFPSR